MVGGTSIGSFVGGVWAREQSVAKVNPIVKAWASKLASLWFYFEGIYYLI